MAGKRCSHSLGVVGTETNCLGAIYIHVEFMDVAFSEYARVVFNGVCYVVVCLFQSYSARHCIRCKGGSRNESHDTHDSKQHSYDTSAKRSFSLHFVHHSFLLSKYTSATLF